MMKKISRILFLTFLLLPVTAQTLFAYCRACSRNSVAVWTSAGYSNIMNHSPETRAFGGLGASIGVGYQYTAPRGFLFQTGLELSLYNSLMHHSDTLHVVPMYSTQLKEYDGLFSFENINSRQRLVNVGPTFMIGAQSVNNFYFLVGGKVKFNVHGMERVGCVVTKRARFDNIIGDDHDGILSNMPNHGLGTFNRSHDSPLRINPLFIGSFEVGRVFSSGNNRNPRTSGSFGSSRNSRNTNMRLSVFCDYGFSRVSASDTHYDLIINSHPSEYLPHITGFLHHDVQSRFVSTLFTGVRLTFFFDIPKRYRCSWQM